MLEKDLRDQLFEQGVLCRPRSNAYAFARDLRSRGCFARVIQVSDLYFVISNEYDYYELWELRKACRAFERSLKK